MASFITAGNATNGLQVSSDNTGILELKSGTGSGTTAVTVNASQNVGIGTSSPASRLEVRTSAAEIGRFSSSAANGGFQIFFPDNQVTPVYVGAQKAILGTGNATDFAIVGTGVNNMVFGTASVERVRITSAGDLLVNRTTQFNSEKFGVTFSSNTGAGVVINDSNGQNGNTFIQFRNSGTTAGAITSNGTTTMTYGSASDYRLKENLVPLTGALAKIAALQPKAGNWKADGSEFIGFVAHELQEVFPDSVVGEKDKTDAEGNPEYQMVDTGSAAIIATLTAAIQEQQAMIDEMKAEIAALKGAA